VLYVWHHHPGGILQPSEFIRKVMPSCPFCLRPLEPPRGSDDVVVRPLRREEREELVQRLLEEAVVVEIDKGMKVKALSTPLRRAASGASPSF
jgi:hypothetical protein